MKKEVYNFNQTKDTRYAQSSFDAKARQAQDATKSESDMRILGLIRTIRSGGIACKASGSSPVKIPYDVLPKQSDFTPLPKGKVKPLPDGFVVRSKDVRARDFSDDLQSARMFGNHVKVIAQNERAIRPDFDTSERAKAFWDNPERNALNAFNPLEMLPCYNESLAVVKGIARGNLSDDTAKEYGKALNALNLCETCKLPLKVKTGRAVSLQTLESLPLTKSIDALDSIPYGYGKRKKNVTYLQHSVETELQDKRIARFESLDLVFKTFYADIKSHFEVCMNTGKLIFVFGLDLTAFPVRTSKKINGKKHTIERLCQNDIPLAVIPTQYRTADKRCACQK